MTTKILIYTDSRGQHTPSGAPVHPVFAERLASHPDVDAEVVLCPMKWTTTLDFLEYIKDRDPTQWDHIILYTGIVEWSPRPQPSAINDLYNNAEPSNLSNTGLNTRDYSKKVVNNKKPAFDAMFGEAAIQAYLSNDFGVEYEGQPTVNMYGLEMGRDRLLPVLKKIPNLIFINSNRFIPGWEGDFKRGRPANIRLTEAYSELFRDELGPEKVIDLLAWGDDDIKRYTCDNLHLTKEGSDWIYDRLVERLAAPEMVKSGAAPIAPFGRAIVPPVRLSDKDRDAARRRAGLKRQDKLATLIIGIRLHDDDPVRIGNLVFLLDWINHFYGDLFDVLLLEQDVDSKIERIRQHLRPYHRHKFVFNDKAYNRGWGYNVAVRHHTNNEVVALMDTDVLPGENFVDEIIRCRGQYKFVSPYTNVYFTDDAEAESVRANRSYGSLNDLARVTKPTTITGGIVIANRTAYTELAGFEQYTGYGGEDRALDVTIFNHCSESEWRMAPFTYVHLHHPPGKIDHQNLKEVLEHLKTNYGCVVDRTITADGFIHKNCPHVGAAKTEVNMVRRRTSYGDANLYASGCEMEVNGVVKSSDSGTGARSTLAIFPPEFKNIDEYAEKEHYKAPDPDRARLAELYNIHKGERCFIIGNGPSLNKHDLQLLKGEHSFGVNSFFYKTRETGFMPTYFVVEDNAVMKDNIEEIRKYDPPFKFFPTIYKSLHPEGDNVFFFEMNRGFYEKSSPNYCVPRFSTDATRILYCGQSVTYINLQLAFFMGFTEVYLIGMDFDYVIPKSHERRGDLIISNTDDPNHFHKDYFGAGKIWKDPKLDRVAMNYRQAKLAYEAVGRKIYNATVGGKLEIFDRVNYEALLRDPVGGRKRQERVPPVVIGRAVEADGTTQSGDSSATKTAAATPTSLPQKQMIATDMPVASAAAGAAVARASAPASNLRLTASEKATHESQVDSTVRSAWYAPIGNAIRSHVPVLFPVLQRFRRIIWKLVSSPAVWIAAIGGAGAIALALRGPWPLEQRLTVAGTMLGAGALAALALLAWRLRRYVMQLSAQNRELYGKIEHMQELTKGRDAWASQMADNQIKLRGELSQHAARLRSELSKKDALLRRELVSLRGEANKTSASVRQGVSAELGELEARLKADMEAWEARQKALGAEQEEALEFQLDELHQRINATWVEQLRQQDRIEALKAEADSHVEAAVKDVTERLAGVESNLAQRLSGFDKKIESSEEALAKAKAELEDSLKALRQGLEQRMHAEIDEYGQKSTAELIDRLDAIEVAQSQGDESYKAGLAELRKTLDDEFKPQVSEVRDIALVARTDGANAKKALEVAKAERARLLERAQASERQIGALRYPDAPDVFVFFGHHKCASRFFRMEVFERIAESTGARIRKYEITDPPFHYSKMDELDLVNVDFKGLGKNGRDVVLFANASQRGLNKIKRNAKDWKGLRIIRDPRQVLISNYFHHKGDHPDVSPLGWTWDQLVEDKPILNELPKEEGILHELDNISKQVIEDQILAPFDDERVMTIRLEDFSKDAAGHLQQISEFMEVPDVAGINFDNKQANPESGPWKKHFTSKIRERFKERYGQALIDLGYAEDMDW